MSRIIRIVCDKCGVSRPGSSDPLWCPPGWGSVDLSITEETKGGKARETRTTAQICGPCAEIIRLSIVETVSPIGGDQ
jgi:hypothetical protein